MQETSNASMRPGIFTPENDSVLVWTLIQNKCFNEAGDFHPRKPLKRLELKGMAMAASMRPGIFTPENPIDTSFVHQSFQCFNEAGDFHPRKLNGSEGLRLRFVPLQ